MPDESSPWLGLSTPRVVQLVGLGEALTLFERTWRYPAPPRLESALQLRATVELGPLASRRLGPQYAWRSETLRAATSFGFQPVGGAGLGPACACSCGAPLPCAHVCALLLDLGASEPLRAALAAGEVPDPVWLDLKARRAAFLGELQVIESASVWAPSSAARRIEGPVALELSFTDGGRDYALATRPAADEPVLHFRFRHARNRIVASDEVSGLSSDDRMLCALGRPRADGKKGMLAEARVTGLLLDLLEKSGRETQLEGLDRGLRFAPGAARVRVQRERVSSRLLAPDQRVPEARPETPGVLGPVRPGGRHEASVELDAMLGRWYVEGDGGFDVPAHEALFFAGALPYVVVPALGVAAAVHREVDMSFAEAVHRRPVVPIPQGEAGRTWQALSKLLRGKAKLPPPESVGLAARETPSFVLRIEGRPLDLVLRLDAVYATRTLTLVPDEKLSADDELRRDVELEREARATVEALGLAWSDEHRGYPARDAQAALFWTTLLPRYRAQTEGRVTVEFAAGLERVTVRPAVRATARVALVEGLLDTSLTFEAGVVQADVEALKTALRNKRNWVALDDGSVAEISQQVLSLLEETEEFGKLKAVAGTLTAKLSPHQLGRLNVWSELGLATEVDAEVAALRERLKSEVIAETPRMPSCICATLRPYQQQGLAWLQWVHALGAGAVLADDMGLGKTLTTLAMLERWREDEGSQVSLVVAPTSVAGNWLREARRFTPALKTLLLHGSDRTRDAQVIAGVDLVVTTYALLRRDLGTLRTLRFRAVVFDEAQQVKNAGAQSAQAARELDAVFRLALTGTPVENRLAELWAIVDLVNPGMLGSARAFANRYERPIALEPHGVEAHRLRSLVRPFLLRRRKREVLTELPPKEEINCEVELNAEQKRRYDTLSEALRQELAVKIAAQGLGRSGLAVLTALLRLRQMACDPRLVDPKAPAEASSKREAFLELVDALVEEGRRVLVFSQFVELLSLWRRDLDARGLRYEYLDGGTVDRDAVVERFQQGDAPLFLISLKAGGTGLNLTAADTVIHCDPWWNPAVEDQATDRAHRMGQERPVTVYRLIALGTVEDRIMLLKERKRGLADAVIADGGGALAGLTPEDLDALLGAASTHG
ncbi:MAG: DEAD/DEAH box helicase family protein [Myxococcales bacterium]|nr:DEAD/DEAH box helicase family protein [Myxococcales bacterium]